MGSCTAEDLVLLLEQPDPLLQLPRLSGIGGRLAGTVALLDISLAEPVLQGCFVDTEVGSDLLMVTPLSRRRATATTSSRNSLG